jgi:hypothetical protein
MLLELLYTSWDMSAIAVEIWQEESSLFRQHLRAQWEANKQATGGHNSDPAYQEVPFPPFKWDDDRRAHIRARLDAYYARLYGLTRDELRYILDPVDIYGPDFPGETFRVLKEKEIKEYGEYRTQRLVLEAWDAQQSAIDSGELPWDHPEPGPSAIGPNAQPASAIEVENRPIVQSTPPKRQAKAKSSAKPKKLAPANQAEQLTLPQVQLPDLSLASEGTFSQRLKRVQKLSKNPSPAQIAELTVYLAAPESSLRWLASSTLSKIGGVQVEAAVKALLEKDISVDAREEAEKIQSVNTSIE